jgi:hypothetical protein
VHHREGRAANVGAEKRLGGNRVGAVKVGLGQPSEAGGGVSATLLLGGRVEAAEVRLSGRGNARVGCSLCCGGGARRQGGIFDWVGV